MPLCLICWCAFFFQEAEEVTQNAAGVTRVILCSGQMYYDLAAERTKVRRSVWCSVRNETFIFFVEWVFVDGVELSVFSRFVSSFSSYIFVFSSFFWVFFLVLLRSCPACFWFWFWFWFIKFPRSVRFFFFAFMFLTVVFFLLASVSVLFYLGYVRLLVDNDHG